MKQETLQLTGGGPAEKRRELDFYPTPKNVTVALMDFLFSEDRIDKACSVLEPACGTGAMSRVIESYGLKVTSSDLKDYGFGTPNVDFTKYVSDKVYDAVITNPPFDESVEFIKNGLKSARLEIERLWFAAEESAKKNFPTPLNRQGEPMVQPPGNPSPYGFRKFIKIFKKGFVAGVQSEEAKKYWSTKP